MFELGGMCNNFIFFIRRKSMNRMIQYANRSLKVYFLKEFNRDR